jgi:hypothetical protein
MDDEKTITELVDGMRKGAWLRTLTNEQNRLLADFLKTSMAKQCKKVAIAKVLNDGVLYGVYKVRYKREEDIMDIIFPGEVYVHRQGDELNRSISNVPRVTLATLCHLGDIVE